MNGVVDYLRNEYKVNAMGTLYLKNRWEYWQGGFIRAGIHPPASLRW